MNGDTHPQQDSEPKIIVDSDWKEQVAREKELAAKPAEDAATEAAVKDAVVSESKSAPKKQKSLPPPPPASFEVLVSMLFTQAMSLLGELPDATSGEASVNKPYAKHYIDTLDMLSEKTKGNLSSDEAAMVSQALHALRMAYVNVR